MDDLRLVKLSTKPPPNLHILCFLMFFIKVPQCQNNSFWMSVYICVFMYVYIYIYILCLVSLYNYLSYLPTTIKIEIKIKNKMGIIKKLLRRLNSKEYTFHSLNLVYTRYVRKVKVQIFTLSSNNVYQLCNKWVILLFFVLLIHP